MPTQPDNSIETKCFGAFEIKDETAGEVSAIVATLGVVDKDGDVLLPGSFPQTAKVKMSGYAHDVITEGAPPVGKGTISIDGDKAIFTGKFFMTTARGLDAFHTVKELGTDGEWSFGFPRNVQTTPMTDDWKAKGARRLITGLSPIEASPVFVGAGVGTQTLFTKDAPDPAIEAARIEAKRKEDEAAEATRIETEAKAKDLARVNADADRIFSRRPRAA
jgi:hypothetical protein